MNSRIRVHIPIDRRHFLSRMTTYLVGGVSANAVQANETTSRDDTVTYEAFGAVGDGQHDDLPSICRAHRHANRSGLSVRTRPDAIYHLGRQALTAVIATDTDWGASRFIIDDTDVDDHQSPLFDVRSLTEPLRLPIKQLRRDQKQLDLRPDHDCYVLVTNQHVKRYRRRGRNQNDGKSQRDCFILRRNGSVQGDIDWNYDRVTGVTAHAIPRQPLTIRGGTFRTVANQMKQDVGYNYWSRNIVVRRSNTIIDGLVHHVTGEGDSGHPYSGFINIRECADVALRDCFATGHRVYKTIGAAGKPVSMGTYDYSANSVVNLRMIGCRMDNILDRSLWGVIGTNYCKNITLEDCTLSRMDTHMGVSGVYTIRRCTLGHAGLNAIGRGQLTVEDSTLHGRSLINFRQDYGSTWDGDVIVRNCRWLPRGAMGKDLFVLNVDNDGTHDFGYPCFMPRKVLIDGLQIQDAPDGRVAGALKGNLYLFSDPDNGQQDLPDPRPYPYRRCERATLRRVTAVSDRELKICPNDRVALVVNRSTQP